MKKPANPDHPILPLISDRWSPRNFSNQPIEAEKLASLFEAARWAPSCYNDQPWNFLVATKADPEAYQQLLDCLIPFNAGWAHQAPVLVAAIAQTIFKHNGQPNDWGQYDLGQAMATLCVEATGLGLHIHQMAGFDKAKVITTFNLADTLIPTAMAAIGYPGDPATLSDDMREKELAPRSRYPLSSFVFTGAWGKPAPFASP